jgi:ABC-type nickel/cobalt efflux system permease component RcnA
MAALLPVAMFVMMAAFVIAQNVELSRGWIIAGLASFAICMAILLIDSRDAISKLPTRAEETSQRVFDIISAKIDRLTKNPPS